MMSRVVILSKLDFVNRLEANGVELFTVRTASDNGITPKDYSY